MDVRDRITRTDEGSHEAVNTSSRPMHFKSLVQAQSKLGCICTSARWTHTRRSLGTGLIGHHRPILGQIAAPQPPRERAANALIPHLPLSPPRLSLLQPLSANLARTGPPLATTCQRLISCFPNWSLPPHRYPLPLPPSLPHHLVK